MVEKAKIIYNNRSYDFAIIEGTDGNKAIDMTKFRALTGLWSYDPGFANTAASQSSITYLDGDNGILRYRGYPIEEICEHLTYAEMCWLTIRSELPTKEEARKKFNSLDWVNNPYGAGGGMSRLIKSHMPNVISKSIIGKNTTGKQANIFIGVNMEFVRHADKNFEWGVEKAAEIGYEYVEPMVHWGREL